MSPHKPGCENKAQQHWQPNEQFRVNAIHFLARKHQDDQDVISQGHGQRNGHADRRVLALRPNPQTSVLEIALELKNQKLELKIEDETFVGDLDWTSEAVSNILKNCMEHTPENGKITVEAEETPIYTKIKITDNGGGINEADLPHLFERFYKGSNSANGNFGIGLNLAYLIVSEQNGTLKAYNQNGGACFEIKFYKAVV